MTPTFEVRPFPRTWSPPLKLAAILMRPWTSNRIINHFKGTCSPSYICSQHRTLYVFPVLCYISGGGRSHDADHPSRRWSINFSHGKSWPQLGITTRFIIHHLPALLVSKQGEQGEQGERGLELMSRQIGVRVLKCSQLEEETFGSRYRVSQSHIWYWGGAGASLSHGDTPSRFCHSSPATSPTKKNLSVGKMFFCLSPGVKAYSCGQMPERGLTRYGFLLYIVPRCPSPPQQAFRSICYDLSDYAEVRGDSVQVYGTTPKTLFARISAPSMWPLSQSIWSQACSARMSVYLYILFIQDHVCWSVCLKQGCPNSFPWRAITET